MKQINRGIVIMSALVVSSCCTTQSKPETPAAQPGAPVVSGTLGEQAVKVTAKVKKVDLKTRHVTLEGPDGKRVTVTAGDEVRNLAQVKAGDDVVVTYYESIAYEVKKPGDATPGVAVAEGAQRAKLGEKPGASTVSRIALGVPCSKSNFLKLPCDGKPSLQRAAVRI